MPPPPRSASSGLPVASPAAAAAAAAAVTSSPPRAAPSAASTASSAAAFLSSPLGSATPRSSPRLADKVKRHHSALAAAATSAALPHQQQGANHSARCADSTPPRSSRPPHGHSHQAAAAGAQKQSPAAGVAAKNAPSAVPLPHAPLVRAQSCGAAPGYHKQLLPSNRECGVDFITPRTAAMLLLAQQHQEAAAATAAANNNPATRLSDAASSLLGPLTPLEHSQLAEWGRAYDKVHVLDARFEYEYEGGHIRGAVNVTSHAQAEAILMGAANENDKSHAGPSAPHRSGSRVCVLIHCEFSKKRGPKCFSFLRQRDRALNLHRYPELNFPELYVIAGGYQAFFLQSIPASGVSTSPSLCSIGANDKAVACASAVAHALCTPPEYVAMADKRYRKEYAIAWSRMKKSGAAAGANGTLVGGAGGFHSPKENSGNGAAENGAGGSGSNGKNGGPPRSRQGRTRSFAEMDSSSNNSPASCGTHSVHSSPAFMARSLSAVAALCSPASAASPVLGLMGSPIVPSHPRPNRGLSLSLDSSAAAGGSNGAALAASTAAPFATAVPAPRRTNSAFSFKRTSSAASLAAMSGLGIGVPPSNSPSPSPSPSSAAAGAGVGAGSAVPSFPSFFGSGSVQPCSSPILSYGWSTEGRSSTPSPFMPESPRFSHSHSRSSAPSPLGWNSPSLGGFGSGSGSGSGAGAAFGYASSARGTPLSMLSEDSPRSRSASVVPGTFAGSSAAATVGALPPPMLAVGASSGGFASPQGRRRARAASALDFASVAASGALSHSQSRSPSSALHSMNLRSSPSLSMSGNSASTSSYAYAHTLSSRSSSSPSPAPFDCASASAYCGGVASPDAHVRAHSVTGHMDSPPGLMPTRAATVAAGASPSQKQEMEVGGESEVPAAAGSSAQKRARFARERGDRDRAAAPHTAVALVYPPSPPLAPAAAPGTLGVAAVTISPSKPTVTTRLASAHAELAAATAACAMEQ